MNIYQIFSETPRAELLATIGFLLSVATITLFTHYLMGIPWLYGVLFGSICGGSSSIAVVSLARRIKVSERCATTITLESAITDIPCIVISLSVIRIILTGQADYATVGKELQLSFQPGCRWGAFWSV